MVIALLALMAAGDWRDDCRVLVDKGDNAAAADCYGDAAAAADNDDDAAFAIALADVVTNARLRPPVLEARVDDDGFDLSDFGFSGRAEVIGLALVDGAVVGAGVAGVASSVGITDISITLLPVIGAVVAGGGGAGAMVLLRHQLSPGDVHVLRASLLLAPYEAATAALLVSTLTSGQGTGPAAAASIAATVGTVGVGVALAAGFDVDPAAPSLAVSFGWIGGATALLLYGAADVGATDRALAQQVTAVAALGVHAGLIGGFALAPSLHLSRPATLLVDAGGAAGLLAGAALAFGLNAPNPQIGYGAIATATVVGAGLGVVGAVVVGPDDAAGAE